MQSDHWRLPPVDLADFFRAVRLLDPPAAFVALADGDRSSDAREAISRLIADPGQAARDLLWRDFRDAEFIPVTDGSMTELAALVEAHAEPEIAIHVAAIAVEGRLLEWFDVPDDSVSISPLATEASVLRFAQGCETTCEWVAGGV